jgi:hypothetical protein
MRSDQGEAGARCTAPRDATGKGARSASRQQLASASRCRSRSSAQASAVVDYTTRLFIPRCRNVAGFRAPLDVPRRHGRPQSRIPTRRRDDPTPS